MQGGDTHRGRKRGRVKAALGESIHSRGHRRGTTQREARRAQGAGGRAPPKSPSFISVSLKSAGLSVSPIHSFSPFAMEQEAPPGMGLGGLARGQVTGSGLGEGGPAVTGRNGSPRGASWRECTFSPFQRLAGASSLLPAPHAEAFPSLHEDLFTAPKTADIE